MTTPVRIKICGISNTETLAQVLALKPDFVGFVHHSSSVRHVDLFTLKELITQTKSSEAASVLVAVDPDDALLDAVAESVAPDYLQLHGNESPQRVAQIKQRYPIKIIKSFPVKSAADISQTNAYASLADMLLFDAKAASGEFGGTGQAFDWNLLQDYRAQVPWFLSGGLSAENVQEALGVTRALLVDVSSHIETPIRSGQKDIRKVLNFMQTVRSSPRIKTCFFKQTR